VLKGSGNNGKGVWLVKDEKELEEKFSSAELLANNFTGTVLLQEYVPNQFDIRILVYKDQVLWALKRAATDGFYNNRSRGGDVEQIAISDAEAQVAIKAAKVMEIDLAGVDLVRTTSGYYLWEVNKSAMTDQSMELTGIDVPALIIDSID
jgi:ribosomal protein S6--L-glutamate ligase